VVAAAVFLGPHELGARALVIAIVVGGATATVRDRRSCAGVAVFGALVYVGFLAHRDGDLTGDASAWAYTVLITVLAASGQVVRWAFTSAAGVSEPAPELIPPTAAETTVLRYQADQIDDRRIRALVARGRPADAIAFRTSYAPGAGTEGDDSGEPGCDAPPRFSTLTSWAGAR
jgi:hypothetical protein